MSESIESSTIIDGQSPDCIVAPLPQIGGELRKYRGFVQPFASHSHSYYVIGRVREGGRLLELNGKEMSIGSGDMIVFNPGDVHGCTHAGANPFAYDSITVSVDLLDGAKLSWSMANSSEDAAEAFDKLISSLATSDDESLVQDMMLLASLIENTEPDVPQSSIHGESALRVYAHLCGHLAEPASVSKLAKLEGLSEYSLIRAYRKRFSITPVQHLMSLRVECACELRTQGASPADVAAETGFADQAHLTRVFKQRIGTTPAAYRKMKKGWLECL